MEAHPAAALFPMLSGDELTALVNDVKLNGLMHPIVTWRGLILDGRNRALACDVGGVRPKYKDMSELSEADAVRFVISCNLRRRHLEPRELAFIADELARLRLGDNQHSKEPVSADAGSPVLSQAEAAESVGVGRASVQRAREIREKAPDLVPKVQAGEISLSAAAKQARARAKPETNPDLAADRVVDATIQRTAEGDTKRARNALAALAALDDTERTFIRDDVLRMFGARRTA